MARRKTPPKTDPKLAVAYLRISKTDDEDKNLGPDAQRSAITAWAAREGVQLAAWHFDDGVSGGAPFEKRLALVAALDGPGSITAHGAGLLVVAKRDRLARDAMVAAMVERLVERKGARIASADGIGNIAGPEGMILRGMIDLFAQYERAVISARTTAALAVKRTRGERLGNTPFGFHEAPGTKMLEPDPDEQAALSRLRKLRASGTTLRGIVETLNAEGAACRGKRWHLGTVAALIKEPSHAL